MSEGLTTPIRARLRAKGQVTVPPKVRELLGVSEGDQLIFYVNSEGQVVIGSIPRISLEQTWFWQERWQKMERAAQENIDTGQVRRFENFEEALRALDEA